MTLKTDYYEGATGLHQQMNDVFDQGVAFVVANMAALTAELQTNAASGLQTFTITIGTAFEPEFLRLEGNHWEHYQAGIISGLADEDIYSNEVAVTLNTSDQQTTSIDFNFTF